MLNQVVLTGDLSILDGRRYQYKGFKKGVAIEGNFASYEYILEGLFRLQIGFDKGRIETGIPYNYLRKCPPEIQSVQMNYWIEHEKNEQLFARFDRNSVRAIFTPKYKPVDNMDVILEIYGMGYRPETQVQCHLDEEFMSLSIMDGEKVFEINGDRFRPGVSISNSEVGLASLSVSAFIFRLFARMEWFQRRNYRHHTGMFPQRS